MAGIAIFLHGVKKTKNSNAEKRFPFFLFTLVTKKAFNLSLMVFVSKIKPLFLFYFFLFSIAIAGLGASFAGGFSFSFMRGGCKAKECIDNG